MENAEIARVFFEMADILELSGGNPFKVRAYRQAAQVLDTLAWPVQELLARGELKGLPGIGSHMLAHIEELLTRGDFREHEQVASKVPPGIREMLQIEGVGPKTAMALWKDLKITSLAELEQACQEQRILSVPRMGKTRARAILEGIRRYRARQGRIPLHRVLGHADALLQELRQVRGVVSAEVAGSVRRRCETVGDLDLLVATKDPRPALRALTQRRDVAAILAQGPTKASVRLKSGLKVDARAVEPKCFGAALYYFTGSKAHNIAVRLRAVRLGLKINEYGVFDRNGRFQCGTTEEEVFAAVGLPFIPPELREGAGEVELAEAGKLPRLVEEHEVLGDLHVHSYASSDARSSVEELAKEAERLGRKYLAITDHSRSRPLGLEAEVLVRHAAAIRALEQSLRGELHLLAGIEVDILGSGELDLPEDVLSSLDWVVASIHARFNDPGSVMTGRIAAAIRSGVVDVIGHPSGRQIGVRDAYEFDLEHLLSIARARNVALEVNAMPERLDLTDKQCRLAKEAGVPVVISSDAHHVSHLESLRYGVWVARRGGLEAKDVLNTRGLDEIVRWRRQKRRLSAPIRPSVRGRLAPVRVTRRRRQASATQKATSRGGSTQLRSSRRRSSARAR